MFVPQATKAPSIKRVSIRAWEKGTVTELDDGRTPVEALRSSGNVILQQDGTVSPRGSLVLYGPQPTGIIRGEVYEFIKHGVSGREIWMICLQDTGTHGKLYVAKGEHSTWTECTGATYDRNEPAHFKQVANKIIVTNGKNNLSFVDTDDFTITTYDVLVKPATPTGTLTGLSGTGFNIYYAVTANSSVGQTEGSNVLTKAVSVDRDSWNASSQSIKVDWSAVTGAKSYNLYCGISSDGAGQPKLYMIAGGLTGLTFTDNGTAAQDPSRPLPAFNSTSGPKATRAETIDGRIWLVGDADNPYYVWRGGDFNNELDFSPSNGGGYTPVGSGTKDIPNSIKLFRDGQGNTKIMVLAQGTNGTGKRFFLAPTTLEYGSSSFTVWEVKEDYGQDGTDSPDGAIVYQDSVYYPSRDGFKTTGTKPQRQNVLSTDRISNTIQRDVSTINTAYADKAVGLAYEGRLYWALPVGSNHNNQVWVLDLDRGGAWMKPWTINCDWMWLYNDNSGKTHFCMLVDNQILELSYALKTTDNGVYFPTSLSSGQSKFSDDGREWGKLIQLVFVLLRPQGRIGASVTAKTEDGVVTFSTSSEFTSVTETAGWDEARGWDTAMRGWDEIYSIAKSNNPSVAEIVVEIDEDVQWFQYGLSSNSPGVDYNLSDVIALYVPAGIKDL